MRKITLSVWLTCFLLSPLAVSAEKEIPELQGKRVVLIIPELFWHSHEYMHLKTILDEKGAATAVASTAIREISQSGVKVTPDLLVKEIRVGDVDAIVFIGGAGCLQYTDDYDAHRIIKQAVRLNIILGGLQVAPYIFDAAGVLEGKRVTAFNPHNLKRGTAIITSKKVERDGNLITASMGSGVLEEFGKTLVKALGTSS